MTERSEGIISKSRLGRTCVSLFVLALMLLPGLLVAIEVVAMWISRHYTIT